MHRRMYPSCITVIHAGYLQDTSTIRIPLASFVRYVHDTCIYDMSYLPTTGVPKLAWLQRKMKTLKAGKTSGIQVTSLLELKQFMTPLLMPPSISALTAATSGVVQAVGSSTTAGMRMVHIPLPLVYDTEGACLTGPAQIGWMGQLVNMPLKFVLHADGKHKLHHGGWLLITLGTHFLRWDTHHLKLSTRFAPLMYLFCKQQETLGAAKMLIDAVQTTCTHYFGKTLKPGAMMSDRSDSFRAAFNASYGVSGTFGQCWPHITRKFAQGEYAKKTWAHFKEAQAHIQTIHMAGSPPMKEMLIREVGLVWDKWGGKHMDTFWNSYCVSPWDCWSVGDFACMLCTPNQNTQESWHLHLQTTRVPALFRASTEYVFAEGLPQLIELDGIGLPKVLNFSVPCIPKGKMQKALWYVEHQASHILIKATQADEFVYYFLRKDNPLKVNRITKGLVAQYESALEGIKDARCKHIDSLTDVCNSFHFVCEAREEYGVPDCEGNPALLDCPTCKAFKGVGICSHVLAINHILKRFNVRYQLATIGKKTDKLKKGPSKKNTPALERIPQREPDSSDEEEEQALLLGAQGK